MASGSNVSALETQVRMKARTYMMSKPGLDNAGCNTNCHGRFRRLIEGDQISSDDLLRLNEILDYRLGLLVLADVYCNALELAGAREGGISQFGEFKWEISQVQEAQISSIERVKGEESIHGRFVSIKQMIWRLEPFDRPVRWQGFSFTKPTAYLAARLAGNGMPLEEIQQRLDSLLQRKHSLQNSASSLRLLEKM